MRSDEVFALLLRLQSPRGAVATFNALYPEQKGHGAEMTKVAITRETAGLVGPSEARAHIDDLLDELKPLLAEELSDEQLREFAAGRLAIMATIRLSVSGKIPQADKAVWTTGPG